MSQSSKPVIFKSGDDSMSRPSVSAPGFATDSFRISTTPRPEYLDDIRQPSVRGPVKPKSKLLITDLDNTLYAPSSHTTPAKVTARPYLHTYLSYILHPDSPWQLACWTFSGESWGIIHLRYVKEGRLFLSEESTQPLLAPSVAAFWGYEQSGLPMAQMQQGASVPVKDLEKMWTFLNAEKPRNAPVWSEQNSFLVDDQVGNGGAQPANIIVPPVFRESTPSAGIEDDFLLQLIGALDELAPESNYGAAIQARGWNVGGIPEKDQEKYWSRGRDVCQRMGIKISRGKADKVDPSILATDMPVDLGEPHDEAPHDTDRTGRVSNEALHGCCQDPPHPAIVASHGPDRDADGMVTHPRASYDRLAAQPSSTLSRPRSPLICFDLDGTLYCRPPCHLDPLGYPAGRPYLRTLLTWLLRPGSPWTVALWTASEKPTAVRCLNELGLGLVGPDLINGEAELLHPKLVALWARDDIGLSKADYHAYVGVVKDFDRLWSHLAEEHVGQWDATNTVMVDDTPNKLRAQPDTVIAAPTFNFPLEPGPATTAAQTDTFLLELIGMLDDLGTQSNFANSIASRAWNDKESVDHDRSRLVSKALALLARDNISIYAEGRGPIKTPPHERRLPFKIGTTVVAPPLSAATSNASRSSRPSVITGQNADHDDDEESSDATLSPDVPPPGFSLDDQPTFVNEEEERLRRRGLRVPVGLSRRQRLNYSVGQWEDEVHDHQREADTVPLTENDPYERGQGRAFQRDWRSYRDGNTEGY